MICARCRNEISLEALFTGLCDTCKRPIERLEYEPSEYKKRRETGDLVDNQE